MMLLVYLVEKFYDSILCCICWMVMCNSYSNYPITMLTASDKHGQVYCACLEIFVACFSMQRHILKHNSPYCAVSNKSSKAFTNMDFTMRPLKTNNLTSKTIYLCFYLLLRGGPYPSDQRLLSEVM